MTAPDTPIPESLRRAALAWLHALDPAESGGAAVDGEPRRSDVEAELAHELSQWLHRGHDVCTPALSRVSGDLLAALYSCNGDLIRALLARLFEDDARAEQLHQICRSRATQAGLAPGQSSATGDVAARILGMLGATRTFENEAQFEAYVTQALKYNLINRARLEGRRPRRGDIENAENVADPGVTPDDEAAAEDFTVHVLTVTRELIAEHDLALQPLLIMRFLENWSVADLARAFPNTSVRGDDGGQNQASIEARIQRILTGFLVRLRSRLGTDTA